MKTWFITGANRGLGLEIGKAALASGDRVVFTSRNADSLRGRFAGQDRALAIPLDMTDTQSIEAAVADAVRHFGRIDVLVNKLGMASWAPSSNCRSRPFRASSRPMCSAPSP